MATKNDKNTMVVINLDRPRFVRFGHSALKKMSVLTGMTMGSMENKGFDFADLEKIMFCGLLEDSKEHGEILKLEDMEGLLDKAENFSDIIEAMEAALEKAFQKTEKEKN